MIEDDLELSTFRKMMRERMIGKRPIKCSCLGVIHSNIVVEEMADVAQKYIYLDVPSFREKVYGVSSFLALAKAVERGGDVKIVFNRERCFSRLSDELMVPLFALQDRCRFCRYDEKAYLGIENVNEGVKYGALVIDDCLSQVHVTPYSKWTFFHHTVLSHKLKSVIEKRWYAVQELERA